MEENYKLYRVRELADGDEDFVMAIAAAFLEEVPEDAARLKKAVAEADYYTTYQAAHKMKPTIDLFELGVLEDLITVQDWGKLEKKNEDISKELKTVLKAIEKTAAEIKKDFNL
ncbi:Hpt domain-containing protein [Gelidibacter japonicus]|jgi:HPt (histidine-containing phosphotransfer) domain-containing protein|uniref:Hpt domain-containing protein n=1 Tax=Gelidibacter japonicus TaxID=1962232 RepID=UPI0013D3A2A0|nr:Hpt domain-containing protein [Gelidibacter japonicus]MCL8006303.1 Hpt domain-containing protein [Gelidibacter japonicus]